MGSDTFYNERRFLWEVIRFVWAVSHIWTAPPVRAEEGAGSACRASPLLCAPQRRGGFFWGVIRFVWAVSHIWTAPRPVGANCTRVQPARARRTGEARHGCRLSLPRAQWARIACRLSLPGSTRRAQPAAGNFKGRGKKSAFGRQKGGRGGGRRLILDLDNTIRQGRGGYFDHTAHQAVRRRI